MFTARVALQFLRALKHGDKFNNNRRLVLRPGEKPMGIGWLWIYSHSDNPEMLARENERRAFAIYSRWRAVLLWTGNVYSSIFVIYHKRLARRTLFALPDHLLRDIGMYRTGSDVQVEEVRRLASRNKAETTPYKNTNKNIDQDQPESVLIIDFDSTQKKVKPQCARPEKNGLG